jgi:hypothetical protein
VNFCALGSSRILNRSSVVSQTGLPGKSDRYNREQVVKRLGKLYFCFSGIKTKIETLQTHERKH